MGALRTVMLAGASAALLAGCYGGAGGAGETATPPAPVIEVYGESTLSGYGLAPADTTPARLQAALPGVRVVNESVAGTTAGQQLAGTDGVHRPWAEQIGRSPAVLVIINRGINEAYKSVPAETFRWQLTELVVIARAAGKGVVLQTPNATRSSFVLDLGVETMAGVVRDVAAAQEVPLSDGYAISQQLLASGAAALLDGVHPAPSLAAALAQDLARLLTGLLENLG